MVNSKRRLQDDSDNEEELKQEILASSSQTSAATQAKRTKLNASAPEPTRLRPDDSSDDEDFDELATPAPEAAGMSRDASTSDEPVRRVLDEEMHDDDDEEEVPSGDEDETIRRDALQAKDDEKGSIAEAGVIDTVIMKNFMCHPHMEVKLNPQINFIIGHNGSGKSVILTAITYAFGAKAAVSGRGTSQTEFIRKGATSCEVMLSLRNKGQEAFRPDTYGKTIWITRRTLLAGGSSSYKIADCNKKTVSTKRAELAAICDHFQIQVDNPVNILHQDMAKLFLHSSKPTDKYRFFLKGTQLEQLMEEYTVLFDQTQALQTIMRSKKDKLDELKEKMKEAHSKWKEIEKARNVEANIRQMKNELAWAHVVEIEKQTQEAVNKQSEEEEKVAKIADKLKATQSQLEEATLKLNEAQAAQAADDAGEALRTEMRQVADKIKDIAAQMSEARTEQRDMQENMKQLREQIAARNKELEEAQSRADGPLRRKMEESRARLQQVDQRREEMTAKVEEHRAKATEMTRLFEEERGKFDNVRSEQEQAKYAFEQAETIIRNMQASQENSLNRFGPHAANIVAAIDRESRWRHKPIGPIGHYIKLKDHHWARVAESVCGDRINSFLVDNDDDRFLLNSLIARFRGARHNVLMCRYDDSGKFEDGLKENLPDGQYTTLLDVLTFDNPWVRQAFINTVGNPEGSILVRERRTGDDIMRNNVPANSKIVNCYTMDLYSLGGIRGGSRMMAMFPYKGPPRLSKDIEADKQQAIQARAQADERLRQANAERARLDNLLSSYTHQKRQAEADAANASRKLRELNIQFEKLQEEAQEHAPPNVQAIETAKQEAQEELDNIKAQGANSARHMEDLQASCKPYVERKEAIKALLIQRDMIQKSQQQAIEALALQEANKRHEVGQWTQKKESHTAKLQELSGQVDLWAERMQEAMEKAGEMCPREEGKLSGSSVKKIESKIASLERALRQQEERLGGSSEEVYKRYVRAKKTYDENRKYIDDLKDCCAAMLEAYHLRTYRWTQFRQHIATHARMLFIRNLASRGFTGDLRFNHDKNSLELRVQPNDEVLQKTSRSKDISTLSGGEKSFSTICLLLALWHAAGCPIRGLDEYDVFMDPVNRKIATKMLIEAGHAANNTQMILISPQAISGHKNTAGVKIIRIADPERGQGTLATNTTG